MKKIFIILMGMALSLSILTFPKVKTKISLADEFCYKSKSYCLMDYNSGKILLGENLDERLPIASMCKIMTLVLCFEEIESGNLSLDSTITVSQNASGMGGSQVFLETNGEYTVETLIKSITIASANDACVAMAEQICGSERQFVDNMNEKASQLGMLNTNFVNATGLPSPGQYSTANDVAIMFRELIKYKDYFKFSTIWMDKVEHKDDRFTEISNTNKLIKFYNSCDGGKTGYTSEAGHCLTATAKRNDLRLIAVVIKAPDSKTRFNEVSTLLNTGFANYKNKLVISKDKPLNNKIKVENSNIDEISIIPKDDLYILTKSNEKTVLDIDFEPYNLVAPINKGDIVGEIIVYKDGVEIKRIDALSLDNADKLNFSNILYRIIDKWEICA